jgi:hypothetical protein
MTKRIIIISLSLITFTCSGQFYRYNESDVLENKSVDNIIKVINEQDLKFFKNKKDIPKIIRRTIKSWDEKFSIVNPGQDYQSTDIVTGQPRRQLIAIFKNKNYFIMTYNHGGYGHHRHIMYFQIDDDKIIDFWVGFGRGRGNEMEDKQNIRDWLKLKADGLQTNFLEY